MDPHQANLHPLLLIFNSSLRFNRTPTSLRVTFDRTLSFSKHVFSLKAKFFPRLKGLCCISASSCGFYKKSRSLLHKAFLRPFLTCASPAWFPFFSVTNINKLERLHRTASHVIAGCLSSSPISLLLYEASLTPVRVTLTHFVRHLIIFRDSSSPNLFYFRFGQTWSETKNLQIVLESFFIPSPIHASF